VFSWTLAAVAVFVIWTFLNRKKYSVSPLETLLSDLKRQFHQLFKSPDTYLTLILFLFGCATGKYYVSATLNKSPLFYTPTVEGLSTPWDCARLLGTVAALTYVLLRTASSRVIAAALSILVLLSPVQLYILRAAPDRDYFRAPWILAIILGSIYMARHGNRFKRIAWGAVTLGYLLGLGTWTRKEIVLFAIPTLLVLLFFTPLTSKTKWQERLLSLTFLLYFFLASSPRPIFDFNAQQASAGYMSSLDNSLGLSRPPYDMGYLHLDEYIDANNAFVTHSLQNPTGTKSFNQIYATTLPADFIARIGASIIRSLTLPFRYQLTPIGIEQPWLDSLYSLRARFVHFLEPLAVPMAFVAFFTLLSTHLRFGVLYLGWLFFLGVLFTTQFWQRHHFYGELFSWWTLAWLLQVVVSLKKWKPKSTPLALSGLVTGFLVLISVGSLKFLRPLQEKNILRLVTEYENAESLPTDMKALKTEEELASKNRKVIYGAYLGSPPQFRIAELGGKDCPFSTLWPTIRYLPIETSYLYRLDWSRTIRVDLNSETKSSKLYFPTWQGFLGIELPSYQSRCLLSLKTLRHPERVSVPLTIVFPFGSSPLFQQMTDLGSETIQWGTRPLQSHSVPHPDSHSNHTLLKFKNFADSPTDTHMLIHRDRSKSRLGALWSADINPSQFDTDIWIPQPSVQKKGNLLVVQGYLEAGGITLGLLHSGERAGTVSVVSKGRFTALFEAQEDGEYQLGISSNLSGYNVPELRFNISRADWITLNPSSSKPENTDDHT
jgi:hypothetical protein